MKQEWYIIINPHAGSGKTISIWGKAQRMLDARGILYRTVLTNYKSHASELSFAAAERGYRKFLTVGGDGSLHEVFCGICEWCEKNGVDPREFHLGVIPIGSGNDWIKSVGIPNDMEKVISLVEKEQFGIEDIVSLDSPERRKYMINIGGVGFDSHVCERVNFQKSIGLRHKMIYANALRYTISHLKAIQVKVIADGKEVYSGDVYSIAWGTGKYCGGGMRQVPDAVMDDGLLDALIVPKLSVTKIIREIPRLFSGTVNESGEVVSLRCKVLEIVPLNAQSADIVELDGEIEGRLPIRLEVTGKQASVLSNL